MPAVATAGSSEAARDSDDGGAQLMPVADARLGRATLLVNPPLVNGVAFTRQGRCQEREEVLGTTKPPYTLALIAALLRDAGCDVRLVDLTAERRSVDDLIARLDRERFTPTLILFPSTTPTLDADVAAIARAQGALRRADVLLRTARVDDAGRVDAARAGRRRHVRRRARGGGAAARALAVARRRSASIPSLTWRAAAGDEIVPHTAHGSYAGFMQMPYPAWDLVAAAVCTRCRSSAAPT